MAIIKAALIQNETSLVINTIMINDQDNNFMEGHTIVPIPQVVVPNTPEEDEFYTLIKQVDPDFVIPVKTQELLLNPGTTKWNENRGFFDE